MKQILIIRKLLNYSFNVFIVFLLNFYSYNAKGRGMITGEFMGNVFQTQFENNLGTSFRALKTKKFSYFITACHLVKNLKDNSQIKLRFSKIWKPLKVKKVIHNCNKDISVFVIDDITSHLFALNLSAGNLTYSQDVFILGFPLGIAPVIKLNGRQSNPIPLVKKGILSGITDQNFLYIDVHINQGFSGGPALFLDSKTKKMKIFGIVSAFKKDKIDGKFMLVNSGIGIVQNIAIAQKIIQQAQKELKDDSFPLKKE